jgi:hypothetical protein
MIGSVLSGEEFNKINNRKLFVKLTNYNENHNGFQFDSGLNVDTVPFNPEGECLPGGIYFCELKKMIHWLDYDDQPMVYYRYVLIPEDSRVYIENDKFKADKLILTKRRLISDILTEKMYIEAAGNDGMVLQYIKKQTEAICLTAVKQNGIALQYVDRQTEQICLVAVQENGIALRYVKSQTGTICLAAVQENGMALRYVKNQTETICMLAVQQNGIAIRYVKNDHIKLYWR